MSAEPSQDEVDLDEMRKYVPRIVGELEDTREELERVRAERDALRGAVSDLLSLHVPYGAYAAWKQTGDSHSANVLTTYDDVLAKVREAFAASSPKSDQGRGV